MKKSRCRTARKGGGEALFPEKKTGREPESPKETVALDAEKGDGKTRRAAAPRDLETGKAAGPQNGKREDSKAGSSEEGRPKKVQEVVVPVWQGPVDWKALEPRLLEMMRTHDARSNLTEAELARRLDMDRRLVHKLHENMKECSIPMLCRWCNGRHMDAAFFLHVAEESLRQEARSASSIKRAKKCPR